MSKIRKTINILIGTIAVILIVIILLFAYRSFKYRKEEVPETTPFHVLGNNTDNTTTKTPDTKDPEPTKTPPATKPPVKPATTPKELNLEMPFYSQAPFGNWDYPWQEACEEASTLLVANVYKDENWTREEFNDEILKMVEWEKKRFGSYLDTDAAQTAEILNDYLGLKTITHDNPSYKDVQDILNKGHFIIMFFAGKELKNPYFTNGGPVYHVLVAKGYKAGEKIITHDVGTRNGANYVYNWSVMQPAMHEYAVPIQDGAKKILEVLP